MCHPAPLKATVIPPLISNMERQVLLKYWLRVLGNALITSWLNAFLAMHPITIMRMRGGIWNLVMKGLKRYQGNFQKVGSWKPKISPIRSPPESEERKTIDKARNC